MTTGYPNDAIDSNEFGPNPNPSVFEWLNGQDACRGRVAVYAHVERVRRHIQPARAAGS